MSHDDIHALRPNDSVYNGYAALHVRDLVARYRPDVLWNDINWPDSGKRTGSWSLYELLADYYAVNPDGVINDRWGATHWDFRTSEYQAMSENEAGPGWENCRGIGLSFGYNLAEKSGISEVRAALGSVRVVCGSVRVNVGELTDGPAAVLFPKR